MKVALDFVKPALTNKNEEPVLFVIAVNNYSGYRGFRMDSCLYSAHPQEKEILFAEGTPVAVLGVEEVKFEEDTFTDDFMKDFNAKSLNIIYLYHPNPWVK